jgi:hypothetical protein
VPLAFRVLKQFEVNAECKKPGTNAVQGGVYFTPKITLLIVVAAVALGGGGCARGVSHVDTYGIRFNEQRARRGVPTIPAEWQATDVQSYFDYSNPRPPVRKPHRLSKRVVVGANGQIASETDTFFSGKSFYFSPKQITLPEEIDIRYDYTSEKTGSPWKVFATLGPNRIAQSIRLDEADQILASWGLSRLNSDDKKR